MSFHLLPGAAAAAADLAPADAGAPGSLLPRASDPTGRIETKNRPGTPGDPLATGAAPSLSLALSALAARLRVVEARIEREPRWVPGLAVGEVCPIQQRLYPRTRGRSPRSLDAVEARTLAALSSLPPGAAHPPSAGVSLVPRARGLLS